MDRTVGEFDGRLGPLVVGAVVSLGVWSAAAAIAGAGSWVKA